MKKGICLLLALLLLLTGCGSSSMKSDTVAETWAASYDSGYGEDALETNGSESSLDNLPQGRKFIIRMDITAEAQELEPCKPSPTGSPPWGAMWKTSTFITAASIPAAATAMPT